MDKRSSKKRDHDFSVTAFRIAQEATGDSDDSTESEENLLASDGKNPNAVALGKLGGKKGGKARAEKLTKEQRQEIARKAAQARWGRNA